MQQIIINSVCIQFEKERTMMHRTEFNEPCDCQDCRNFYANISGNPDLVRFLEDFGVDYRHSEEVFSWDLGQTEDSLIHHEGYYAVFGVLPEDVSIEQFGLQINFKRDTSINHDRHGEYFWIEVIGDYPYILKEPREMSEPTLFKRVLLKLKSYVKN